jgi:Zn-dependent protease with chaperone function
MASVHERLCRAEVSRPSRDVAWVLTYVLAAGVHAVTVAVAVLGIWLCLTGRLVLVPLGLLALAIVVLLRPRLGKLDPEVELLDRDEAPQLYALCDAVADAIGARHIDQIGLDPDFNAYYTVVGIRQRRTMVLGTPLWTVLDRQGRVALLGHELGHGANGDNRQGVFVGGALRALVRWYELVRPGRDSAFAARGNPFAMVAGLLLLIPQAVIGGALYCVIVAFGLASLRVGQRAEYLADAMAVRAGGDVPGDRHPAAGRPAGAPERAGGRVVRGDRRACRGTAGHREGPAVPAGSDASAPGRLVAPADRDAAGPRRQPAGRAGPGGTRRRTGRCHRRRAGGTAGPAGTAVPRPGPRVRGLRDDGRAVGQVVEG